MLDASKLLIDENVEVKGRHDGAVFSFRWLASRVIERQTQGKDTIIVVIGDRRNGKSNWMLKLVSSFVKLKKQADPNFRWKWVENFPLTRSEAAKKAEAVADNSFVVYDEAADIAYRSDTLSMMNKKLIKFMNKSGKKCLLTIIVLPDIYQLDPKILNMAHFLVAVPYRYKKVCAFAFIYGRNPNPLVTDKFGLERIKRLFSSKKTSVAIQMASMEGKVRIYQKDGSYVTVPYPRQMFKFLVSLPTFLYSHRFGSANDLFEKGYIKNVKNNQLMAHETEDKFVTARSYNVMKKRYETLLFNVWRFKTDVEGRRMSYNQLVSLHVDEGGNVIVSNNNISKIINNKKTAFGDLDEGDG